MIKSKKGKRAFVSGLALTLVSCGSAASLMGVSAAPETKEWTPREASTSGAISTTAGYSVDEVVDVRLTPAVGYENVGRKAPDGYWAWGITSGAKPSEKDNETKAIPSKESPLAAYAMSMYGNVPADDAITNAAVSAIVYSELDTGNDLISSEQRKKLWDSVIEKAPQEVKDKITHIKKTFNEYKPVDEKVNMTTDDGSTLSVYIPKGGATLKLTGDAVFKENGKKTLEIKGSQDVSIVGSQGDKVPAGTYNVSIDPKFDDYKVPADEITSYKQSGDFQTMVYAAPKKVELPTKNFSFIVGSSGDTEVQPPVEEPGDGNGGDETTPDKPGEPENPGEPNPGEDTPENPDKPGDNSSSEDGGDSSGTVTSPGVEGDSEAPDRGDGKITSTTTAFDSEDQDSFFPSTGGKITTEYTVKGLTVGKEYVVKSRLLDLTSTEERGEDVFLKDANGKDVVMTQNFKADDTAAVATVQFTVESGAAGRTFVPVHELSTSSGEKLDSSRDNEKSNLFMRFAGADGSLSTASKEDRTAYAGEELKLTANYTNLVPGKEYTLKSTAVDSSGNETSLKNEHKFTADKSGNGVVEFTMTVPENFKPGDYTVKNTIVDSDGKDVVSEVTPEAAFSFTVKEGERSEENSGTTSNSNGEDGRNDPNGDVKPDVSGNSTTSNRHYEDQSYGNTGEFRTGGQLTENGGLITTAAFAAFLATLSLVGVGGMAVAGRRSKESSDS